MLDRTTHDFQSDENVSLFKMYPKLKYIFNSIRICSLLQLILNSIRCFSVLDTQCVCIYFLVKHLVKTPNRKKLKQRCGFQNRKWLLIILCWYKSPRWLFNLPLPYFKDGNVMKYSGPVNN